MSWAGGSGKHGAARDATTSEFVIEMYAPVAGLASAHGAAEIQRQAQAMRREGVAVRYLRSIVIPEDELCFHVVEAPSAEVVLEVGKRASIRFERIAPVVEVEPLRRSHRVGSRRAMKSHPEEGRSS